MDSVEQAEFRSLCNKGASTLTGLNARMAWCNLSASNACWLAYIEFSGSFMPPSSLWSSKDGVCADEGGAGGGLVGFGEGAGTEGGCSVAEHFAQAAFSSFRMSEITFWPKQLSKA